MARTMLFISISPKRSARITVPWTALIYVPAPRPPLNPAASCRDALIGRELETGSPGGRRVCLHTSFFFFPSKLSPRNQTRGRQICSAAGAAGPSGASVGQSWFRRAVKGGGKRSVWDLLTPTGESTDPPLVKTAKKPHVWLHPDVCFQ